MKKVSLIFRCGADSLVWLWLVGSSRQHICCSDCRRAVGLRQLVRRYTLGGVMCGCSAQLCVLEQGKQAELQKLRRKHAMGLVEDQLVDCFSLWLCERWCI